MFFADLSRDGGSAGRWGAETHELLERELVELLREDREKLPAGAPLEHGEVYESDAV